MCWWCVTLDHEAGQCWGAEVGLASLGARYAFISNLLIYCRFVIYKEAAEQHISSWFGSYSNP